MEIVQLIGSYGFPIVACVGMAWYVKYTSDRNREDLRAIQQAHLEETNNLKDALAEVNRTLTELVTLWKKDKEG